MGAVKKSTKKFVKNKLQGVIAQRKKHQAKFNSKRKGKPSGKNEKPSEVSDNESLEKEINQADESDDDMDVENNFGFSKEDLISALKKSKTSKTSKNKDGIELGSDSEAQIIDSSDDSDSMEDDDDEKSLLGSDDDNDSVDIEDMEEFNSDDDEELDNNGDKVQSDKINLKQQINTDISTHKQELEDLKERDPEFYEFLQKNDTELLNFKDEEEMEEKDEEEEMVEAEEEKEEEEEEKDYEVVTLDMIKEWKERIYKTHSIPTLKKMLVAYKNATIMSESDAEEIQIRFKVENDKVFKALILTTIQLTPITLDSYLGRMNEDGTRKKNLPSAFNKWKKISPIAKSYLNSTIKLLSSMTDVDTLRTILQSSSYNGICPYYACFPKLGKEYLKLLVRFWTSADEEIRIVSFLSLRRLAASAPTPYLEMSLKACTNAFTDQARTVNSQTVAAIYFMQDSIAELCALDGEISYQYAFVSVRKLAISLRIAINKRSVETLRQVYNWQFIQLLFLWSKVLGVYCNPDKHAQASIGSALQSLIYPLTQVTIGVLRLKPSSKFIPLKFQCIKVLIDLSKNTKVYIPAASYLLEIFDSAELKTKGKQSSQKPMEFKLAIKVNNNLMGTRVLNDGIILETIRLLGEYYATQESSLAYPELVLPCLVQLKKFSKQQQQLKNTVGSKQSSAFIEKLRNKSMEIERARMNVPF